MTPNKYMNITKRLKKILPLYCQTAGEIVEVQEIFTILDLTPNPH